MKFCKFKNDLQINIFDRTVLKFEADMTFF